MKNTRPVLIVGHRGAKGLALENTAPSVEAALSYGVDQVEIDLRLTSDGVIVLLHDDHAIGRQGKAITVSDHTYAEVLEYFPDMLTLEQVITLINRRCRIMLEYKVIQTVEPSLTILQDFFAKGWSEADFMFASFDFKTLKALHMAMPNVEVVVLEGWSSIRAVHRARKLGTTYLSMDQRFLWWGVIYSLSRKYKLFCYPYRKLIHIKHAKPARWVKYGLYGIITDYPNYFLEKKTTK